MNSVTSHLIYKRN